MVEGEEANRRKYKIEGKKITSSGLLELATKSMSLIVSRRLRNDPAICMRLMNGLSLR